MTTLLNAIPTPAKAFGFAGLIPFFAGALLCWLTAENTTNASFLSGPFILTAYGAVILSFLGGIRWGVAMQHATSMHHWTVVGLAMVPSLIAWAALLMDARIGLLLLMAGFTLQYGLDYRLTKAGETPTWFLTLRTVLTLGAVLSVLTGWLALG